MCITGSGIAIEQHDHLYKPGPTGKKGVRQVLESEHTWRVTFRQGEFKDVWLSERKKPSEKDLFIELRFTCSEAPESVDATELANTATEQADTIVEEGEVDVEGKEKPSTPAEEDEDADEDEDEEMDDSEPNASDHPLAKLFEDPESIPGLEIRLVFRRVRIPHSWIGASIPCIGLVQVLIATRSYIEVQSVQTRLCDWGVHYWKVKRMWFAALVPLASRELG